MQLRFFGPSFFLKIFLPKAMCKRKIFLLSWLFCQFLLGADSEFYRSNQVGLELERISPIRCDEFEYVLEVKKESGRTIKILLHQGREWKRWEIVFDSHGQKTDEYEYENKLLIRHEVYDKRGHLVCEEFYEGGVLKQKRYYFYGPRGLDFCEIQNAQGEVLYHDEYYLAPSGKLRGIRRVYADGSESLLHYTYAFGRLLREWEYQEGRISETLYNEKGQMMRREEWNKDVLELTKEYRYDASGKLYWEIEKDLKNQFTTNRFYDKDGKMVKEKVTGLQAEEAEISYEYDGKRCIAKRKKTALGIEEWRYTYKSDGSLATELYYRRGFLQMRIIYESNNSRQEEYFRDEVIFLRVYIKNEKKLKEEFVLDGVVVRSKEYAE